MLNWPPLNFFARHYRVSLGGGGPSNFRPGGGGMVCGSDAARWPGRSVRLRGWGWPLPGRNRQFGDLFGVEQVRLGLVSQTRFRDFGHFLKLTQLLRILGNPDMPHDALAYLTLRIAETLDQLDRFARAVGGRLDSDEHARSEEHTSEL